MIFPIVNILTLELSFEPKASKMWRPLVVDMSNLNISISNEQ